jgi:hypothetical protein
VKFEALYYQDRLKIVNPEGDVAITTLWSKVESAYQILEEAGVDLAPESSRIGPIANLYGKRVAADAAEPAVESSDHTYCYPRQELVWVARGGF